MVATDIKKELNKLDKDKIVKLIIELYKKNKSVKDFFDFYVDPNEKALLEKYKAKVFEAFYPKKGDILKLKEGIQAINEFKKYEVSAEYVADLMLFYVECGITFTKEFGDIDEQFYLSLERMFDKSLILIKKESLLKKFKMRADKVLTDTDGIGWYFHDTLVDIYYKYYEGSDNEEDLHRL
jgi:hypothetical protein